MSYLLDTHSLPYTPTHSSNDTSPHGHTSILTGHKRAHSDISPSNTENLNTLNLQSSHSSMMEHSQHAAMPYTHYMPQQCSPNMKRAADILSGTVLDNRPPHRPVLQHSVSSHPPPQQHATTPRRDQSAPSQLAVYNSVMSPMSMLMASSDYLATGRKSENNEQPTMHMHPHHHHHHHNQHQHHDPAMNTVSPPAVHSSLQPFNYMAHNVRGTSAPPYDTAAIDMHDSLMHGNVNAQPLQSHIAPRNIYGNMYHPGNEVQPSTPPLHTGVNALQQHANAIGDTPNIPHHMSHAFSQSPVMSYNTGAFQALSTQSNHTSPKLMSVSSAVSNTSANSTSADDTPYVPTNDSKNKYGCVDCAKTFPSKSSLHMHTLTHTGDKPFQCTFPACEKSFRQKGHLVSHYRRHTGEKPFECWACSQQFKDKSGLNTHIRKHHKDDEQAQKQLNMHKQFRPEDKHSGSEVAAAVRGRKHSTSTTSTDRTNSVSPHKHLKSYQPPQDMPSVHHHVDPHQQQHVLQSAVNATMPQHYDKSSLVLASIPPPITYNSYRQPSYSVSTPTSEHLINMSASSMPMLMDSAGGSSAFMHHGHSGGIVSPQGSSMLLSNPMYLPHHQTSEPFM